MKDESAPVEMDIEGLSIIIPAYNEEGNITILYEKIRQSLSSYDFPWEAIFIDDGSEDATPGVLEELASREKRVKVIFFKRNFGKGAAYSAGLKMARYPVLATMDADLQDDPAEIPKFLEKIREGYEFVTGWKYRGKGCIGKSLPSKVFNMVIRKVTKIDVHDFNCPYRVFLRGAVEPYEIYGELYRFMPVIAASKGCRIAEVKVENYPRHSGKSKYGLERFTRGLFDSLTIMFLSVYMKRPLHFFGSLGLVHLFVGFFTVLGLYIRKFLWGYPIKDYQFLFIMAIFLMIASVQLISVGLVSELMIKLKKQDAKFYYIEKTINFE